MRNLATHYALRIRDMYIIGIDLGGTKILGVLADEHGNIAAEVRRPTGAADGREAVVDRIADIVRELMPSGGVVGIGVCAPGPINPMNGQVYDPPNLPGWTTVPLRDMLYERLDLPPNTHIVLANDANAAALAEFKFGAGSHGRL